MPYHWPVDTDFALWELDVLDRDCPVCGRMMYVCDHRRRYFHTLEGPVELVCKLNHCPDPACVGHAKTKSPETEVAIALPKWAIGWDVLCWIGHRRCSRHWSIPQIRGELWDDYRIALSEDSIARYIRHYQNMLAARQQDEAALRQEYAGVEEIILTIDGLQTEKGHETLYVVREVTQKRVWFAEPLISATADEVRRLIAKAKAWADALGKKVVLWLSDRQDAFVTGIAAEFPGTPHRYCANHFLRDMAKPVLDADSHAKVEMRKKVRGLRKIEQAVLKQQKAAAAANVATPAARANAPVPLAATAASCGAAASASASAEPPAAPVEPTASAGSVVLEYCTAVRGILNDDQGGPLQPPGLRMADALSEVRESIQRNLDEKKGASPKRNSTVWPAASTAVSTPSAPNKRNCVAT
ncbi:MAG: transposase [Planctomycetes bacterium]|nr:transposase [Planctomycetota bacterium]